ncbi:dTDP-4-dehydrorhamnose reductase [Cellvibrio sp.]|uniref:dTDP-4-dehydrorhamnose reductase n=1 Tax=Cellvibrio sp. TaxID=1965322 RepID=UPI0039647CDE
MKVLVTGANGQLGMHLVAELQKKDWVNLLVAGRYDLDITDNQAVKIYFDKHSPHVVINAAAFTSVDAAEESTVQATDVNHVGAANLAEASAKINAAIIQISTDYVFSGKSGVPYIESDLPDPVNAYGLTKLLGEKAVASINPRHIILRTSWLFSGLGKNFYLIMSELMAKQSKISVVNDQVGAPTYVLDLINLIVKALEKINQKKLLAWGVYHYSGYPYVSWFDFAIEIKKALFPLGAQCEIYGVSTVSYGSVAKRPYYSCLNSSKACRYFGVTPSDWMTRLNELATKVKG